MAAYDSLYFQAIFKAVPNFRNRAVTTSSVKVGATSFNIHKYYDLKILQFYSSNLKGFDLTKPSEFDRMVDYLYEFQLHPNQEPAEFRNLRDSRNPKIYLPEEKIKERVEINTLPPKQQAEQVKNWANKTAPEDTTKLPPKQKSIEQERQTEPLQQTPKPPDASPTPQESVKIAQLTAHEQERIFASDRQRFQAKGRETPPKTQTDGALALKPKVQPETIKAPKPKEPVSLQDYRREKASLKATSQKPPTASTPKAGRISLGSITRQASFFQNARRVAQNVSSLTFTPRLEVLKAIRRNSTPENLVIGGFALGGAVLGGNNPILGGILGGATGIGVTQYMRRGGGLPVPQTIRGGSGDGIPFPGRRFFGGGGGGSRFVRNVGKKSIFLWLLFFGIAGLLIGWFLFGLGGTDKEEYKLQIVKSGPAGNKVENNQNITFQIKVSFTGPNPVDVEVSDPLPKNSRFVSASEGFSPKNGVVKWNLTGLKPGENKTLSLTVEPTKEDIWVVNSAKVKIVKKYESNLGTLIKGGDQVVENGQNVNYELSITYTGTGIADITVTDPIPQDTQYVEGSASDNGTLLGNTLTWNLLKVPPNVPQKLTFKVVPLKDDIYITNTAEAKISGQGAGGTPSSGVVSPGGSVVDPSSLAGVSDFNTIMRGQGRNVGVLGDENSFVSKVITNGGANVAGKEEYVRTVYKEAAALNVNPLAILVHWGTETGFRLDLQSKAFSCPVGKSTSFDRQARCSAETFDYWMAVFERKNTDGQYFDPQYPKCIYDDPFIFAAEMYGPTCRVYDSNDYYLQNFVKFYKLFLGAS